MKCKCNFEPRMQFKIAGKGNLINLGNEDGRTVDAGVCGLARRMGLRQEKGPTPRRRSCRGVAAPIGGAMLGEEEATSTRKGLRQGGGGGAKG